MKMLTAKVEAKAPRDYGERQWNLRIGEDGASSVIDRKGNSRGRCRKKKIGDLVLGSPKLPVQLSFNLTLTHRCPCNQTLRHITSVLRRAAFLRRLEQLARAFFSIEDAPYLL